MVDGDLEQAGIQTAYVGVDAFASIADALAAYPTTPARSWSTAAPTPRPCWPAAVRWNCGWSRTSTNSEDTVTLQSLSGDAGDAIATRYHGVAGGNLIVGAGEFRRCAVGRRRP